MTPKEMADRIAHIWHGRLLTQEQARQQMDAAVRDARTLAAEGAIDELRKLSLPELRKSTHEDLAARIAGRAVADGADRFVLAQHRLADQPPQTVTHYMSTPQQQPLIQRAETEQRSTAPEKGEPVVSLRGVELRPLITNRMAAESKEPQKETARSY
jgi:hypothetical protein